MARRRVLTDRDPGDENDEPVRVYCWRHEELSRAGYPLPAATAIAARDDIDLHEAVALLERGCPVGKALRILL